MCALVFAIIIKHNHHTPKTTQTKKAKADDGEEMDDLVSAPRMVLHSFLTKYFPVEDVEMTEDELNKLQVQVRGVCVCCV